MVRLKLSGVNLAEYYGAKFQFLNGSIKARVKSS